MDFDQAAVGLVDLSDSGRSPFQVVGIRPHSSCISPCLPSPPAPRTPTIERYEGNPKSKFQRLTADPSTKTSPNLEWLVPSGMLSKIKVLSAFSV